jgi:iron complex transport system ATP-binding protein
VSTLRFENVAVNYGAGPVVSDVSLGATAGEWLAIVGPNGAGKSSLLRTAVAAVEFTGSVMIDGRSTTTLSDRERARMVAYVSQRPRYPQGMAVFDYVLLGRTPYLGTLASESTQDITLVWDALSALRLEEFASRDVSTLSGGETQRVSLARVIAQRAAILVLDEATASLDVSAQHEVLEVIDALRASHDITVVSAIHDLTAAAQFCNSVAIMDRGLLVNHGAPVDVLTESVLQEVFDPSIRVLEVNGDPVIVSLRSEESYQ